MTAGCGSCEQLSFGKRKKIMSEMNTKGLIFDKAYKKVSRRKVSRRKVSRRKVSRRKVSRKKLSRKGRKLSRKGRKLSRKGRKLSRKGRKHRSFGIVSGPGYLGQTSYPNVYSNYFGSAEPFVNPPEFWLPQTGGVIQSPQMLYKSPNV